MSQPRDKTKKRKTPKPSEAASPSVDAPSGGRPPQAANLRFRKVEGSDAKLYVGLAALAGALVALVWWAIPGDHVADAKDDASATVTDLDAASGGGEGATIERPAEAVAKLAVITDRPEDVVRKLATIDEVQRRLEPRHCGPACDAVRKQMSMEDAFELDVVKTDDLILPPRDTMDTVAPGLTPREREQARDRKLSVVVRTRGPFTPEQLPARAAFAAAAVLAEALDGFVYDDVSRRMETTRELLAHTVTAPLGEPAFARKQIVIQMYRQDDGTARLLTLGMARFGSADLALRGASMPSAPLLAEVMNAVASKLVHGVSKVPIKVTLEDVAAVSGKKPADLRPDPSLARPVELALTEPEPTEGDPENELLDLRPASAGDKPPGPDAWDAVVTSLFGAPAAVGTPENDKELAEITKNARRELPGGIKRFQAGEGELFVKGPFPIPYEARIDGGAATELLWIAAAACDDRRCTGVLTNEPTHATNLAAGKITSIERAQVADWMLQQHDGGVTGGDSINALKARTTAGGRGASPK